MDGKRVAYAKRLKKTQGKRRTVRKSRSHEKMAVDESTTSSSVSLGDTFDSLSSSLPPPLELPAPMCSLPKSEEVQAVGRAPARATPTRARGDVPPEIPGFSLVDQKDKLFKSMEESSYGLTLSLETSQSADLQRKCAVCGDDCFERCYLTCGSLYHPRCLACTRCHRHLRPPSCAFMCDLPYCVRCVTVKQEPPRCEVCGMPIFDKRDQVAVDWHQGPVHRTCLRCYLCSEELDADEGTLVGGRPLCGACLSVVSERKCATCGKCVVEDAVEIGDSVFHRDHVVCCVCGVAIKGMNCVCYKGKVFCGEHGVEQTTRGCCVCRKKFGHEPVIKWDNRAYHPACFRCAKCDEVLSEDNWMRVHAKPYCEACYKKILGKKAPPKKRVVRRKIST